MCQVHGRLHEIPFQSFTYTHGACFLCLPHGVEAEVGAAFPFTIRMIIVQWQDKYEGSLINSASVVYR
jgi:hypothetical protein